MSAEGGHGVSAVIVAREPNKWLFTCGCGDAWTATSYEAGEDEWREHVWAISGSAPRPMGDKANRWEPVP